MRFTLVYTDSHWFLHWSVKKNTPLRSKTLNILKPTWTIHLVISHLYFWKLLVINNFGSYFRQSINYTSRLLTDEVFIVNMCRKACFEFGTWKLAVSDTFWEFGVATCQNASVALYTSNRDLRLYTYHLEIGDKNGTQVYLADNWGIELSRQTGNQPLG